MSAPNVLLVCTDQQRSDWLPPTDLPLETPAFDQLAERGVRFSNAVCPSPVCNPSRSCLASGYEYDRCGVPNNEVAYPVERGTLYRRLRDEAGYHVMGCGKFDLTPTYGFGMDGKTGIEEWGFSDGVFTPAKNETVSRVTSADGDPQGPYTAYLAEEGLLDTHVQDYARRGQHDGPLGRLGATFSTAIPDEAYYDEWLIRQGCRLIENAPDDRPWFVQVNLQNPHDPWDVTERMHERFRNPDSQFPPPVDDDGGIDTEIHQEVRRNYAAMVEHLDLCLDQLIGAVRARGDFEDTVIVFYSDHGELLGDYGQWLKDSPLQPSVGVPFVMAGPGITARDPVDDPVTILDLHATVLDYAGLDPGAVDSQSMRALLAGDGEPPRDVVYSGLSTWRMVFDGRFKLIRGYDSERRRGTAYEPRGIEPAEATRLLSNRTPVLYDMGNDGDESAREAKNVTANYPEVVEHLTTQLESVRGRPEDDGWGW